MLIRPLALGSSVRLTEPAARLYSSGLLGLFIDTDLKMETSF